VNYEVRTNLFEVAYRGEPMKVWHAYKMELIPLKRVKYSDLQTTDPENAEQVHPQQVKRLEENIFRTGSTEFTRKIFQELSKKVKRELNKTLAVRRARLPN